MKIKNLALVFLASIIPDISHIGTVVLMRIFHLTEIQAFSYFFPVHTPFFLLFAALAIAFSTKKPKESFIIVFFAFLLHLFLDLLQKGNIVYPLSPFVTTPLSIGVFWQESILAYSLQIASLILLVHVLLKERIEFGIIDHKKRFLLFVLILMTIPLFTRSLVLNNFYYYSFSSHPEDWEGKKIVLSNKYVVSKNPTAIQLEESRNVGIVTSEQIEVGSIVALNGVYKEGKIYITDIHKQDIFLKEVVSSIGLLMFGLILLKSQLPKISQSTVRSIFR